MKCLVNWIPVNTHVRFEQTTKMFLAFQLPKQNPAGLEMRASPSKWRVLTIVLNKQTNKQSCGGGRDNNCPCQWGGEETWAGTYFWLLPTLLLSRSCAYTDWRHQMLDDSFTHSSLKTQPRPGCHNHSLTTSLPRSYTLHSTLHPPHNTSISTHIYI